MNVHHDLSPKRIQRDEEDVKAIINGINDLLTAKEKGLSALNTFIEEQLVKETTDFYEPIKKLKLSTFGKLKKSVKIKILDKITVSMMSQHRNIDMKGIFAFPLGPVLWALADSMETLKKNNKAILMHEIEKKC